jgi:sugar lactone lactonase YvrE
MKHLNLLMLFVIVLASFACSSKKDESSSEAKQDTTAAPPPPPVTLTKKWETDTVLTTCESVLYDDKNNILYVANINGAPDGKDKNGFISKVSLDGKVTEVKWAKGMDAPKGMGQFGDKLFVADIDKVHEINVKTGKITKTYKAPDAKFLNDITVDSAGTVFISDSRGGKIFTIEKGKIAMYAENLKGPNGLLSANGNFYVALWDDKSLNTMDKSKTLTVKTEGIENPDGIEAISNDAYLVSSWNGMIHYIGPDWKKTLVLDTRADSLNAADIEYIQSKNLLLVPGFFKNKVVAYELSK